MLDIDNLTGGLPASIVRFKRPRAKYTTTLAGADNDHVIEAIVPGADGNSLKYVIAVAGLNTPLSVAVSGVKPAFTITVNAATNGSGDSISTAQEVVDAINEHGQAAGIVKAYLKAGESGAGVVVALALVNLAGGSDTGVQTDMGILDPAGARVVRSRSLLDLRGLQFGTQPVKRISQGMSARVEFGIAEVLDFAKVADVDPTAILFDDGSGKRRLEYRDLPGLDMLRFAERWELRPWIDGAETADREQWIILPKAAPSAEEQTLEFNPETQQVERVRLDAYPDDRKRRIFRGLETF